MAPALETNVEALERELIIYEKGIPELLEVDDTWWSMLEKTEADPASGRSTRVPLLNKIQGTFAQADMDNGDLGDTSGPDWIVATLAPIYFKIGFGISAKAVYATQGAERGVKNPLRETFSLAMQQFRSALDMVAETGGNGVLATITSVSTNDLTCTTDGFKAQLVYVGMPVQVFDTGLTTDRGSTTVTAIDRANHIISVAAAPGGTTATDKLVIEGLAAPVTIQSSLFGKQYHHSDATSGLWMAIDRATQLNVRTPSVNASSSLLSTTHIRRAKNKIKEYVGRAKMKSLKLVATGHPCQGDAYEAAAIAVSNIIKQPSNNQAVDLMFDDDQLNMDGTPYKESIHADRTRVDFIATANWQRITATDTGYYRPPGSDSFVFPTYRSGGDGLKASAFFYLKTGLQIVCRNPIAGSFIKTLTVPSGY